MSMYGLAIKNKTGNYVSYDATTDSIIDVDVFQFDGSKFIYKIPAAVNSIKVGDVVVHQGAPCFVKSLPDSIMNTLNVVDVYASEQKEIILPKSIYGFHYCTKVINLMEGIFSPMVADESNPFGNMLPFMLMNNNGGKMDDMLPLMLMMNQNGSGNTNMFANPMMMYMLVTNKDIDPMIMLMMNQPHLCACGKTAKDNK